MELCSESRLSPVVFCQYCQLVLSGKFQIQPAGTLWRYLPAPLRRLACESLRNAARLSLLKTLNAGKTPGFLGFRSFEEGQGAQFERCLKNARRVRIYHLVPQPSRIDRNYECILRRDDLLLQPSRKLLVFGRNAVEIPQHHFLIGNVLHDRLFSESYE